MIEPENDAREMMDIPPEQPLGKVPVTFPYTPTREYVGVPAALRSVCESKEPNT